jgi:hypothetical protein
VDEEERDAGEDEEEEQEDEELGEALERGEEVLVPVALEGFEGGLVGERGDRGVGEDVHIQWRGGCLW